MSIIFRYCRVILLQSSLPLRTLTTSKSHHKSIVDSVKDSIKDAAKTVDKRISKGAVKGFEELEIATEKAHELGRVLVKDGLKANHESKGKAQTHVQNASEKVKGAMHQAKGKVEAHSNTASDSMKGTVHDTMEKIGNAAEKVKHAAKNVDQDVRGKAKKAN
ncbi:hypothetical protein NEOLI_004246 [Neolecta irregularis DAH-3]|uniref:Uncharacterized protein n=1 Tax=Neolecta irregularis (strain DAH-3) TaxID=1198029 RepID=A0A1U7LND7_NEOID|nr:hypothetical protein NEOLI_004246 [Neolecta irregularis DAH-3]|eukprot:OLL24103.1 hypothetical protein NEOLI_004246 [Neolecta irregularis DAH-3]